MQVTSSHLFVALSLFGLAACPSVDLGDTPDGVNACNPEGGVEYFRDEIYPSYIRPTNTTDGCAKAGACHNEAGGNSPRFKTNPVDDDFNYRQAQQFLNCGTPRMSRLLTKPLANIESHVGGDIYFTMDDAEVQVFLGWF